MRNLILTIFSFAIFTSVAFAQDPGTAPSKNDILTEKSDIVSELKAANAKVIAPRGTNIPVQKSKTTAAKPIANQYVVILKEGEVIKTPASLKSSSSSHESREAAAKKHQAAAEKAIRKYAVEKLGISSSDIGEVFSGVQNGFTVKLKNTKSATSFLKRTKSASSTSDVFQDQEVQVVEHSTGEVISAESPAAWAPQYADYGNWVAGGCNCTGHSKWIWVLDTGIDLNHPDLNVKTSYGKSYIGSEPSAEDYHGHGTHVAGIAAAKNNSYGAKGIAYGAWVVPVKVLNRYGSGSWSAILAGLNRVYQYGIKGDVVNLSLGGYISSGAAPTAVENCIKALARKGIYVVMAAGNSSMNAKNFTPARVNGSKIYTIAATQKSPYWWVHKFASNYSNYGKPPVDFAAPGTSIYSTHKNGGYAYKTGTSMAAPNFAGALLCGTKRKKGYYYYKVNPGSHNLYVIRPK
ncbi:MAG: S8 family serine peptidase [Cyanothece sp. SIO1E1]|nr:S8 family serine peptidase [Cyanothece sp. SIO1E1]